MAAFSRGLKIFSPSREHICSRCLQFSTTSASQSGHNRWSKIKHDKGAVDAKKNILRSSFAKEIMVVSKLYGGNPNFNPRLATVLQSAKKAGFPKASMEAAIARGLGKSTSGAALESMTFEVLFPPTIAMIIEAETDNKNRTQQDLRTLIKHHGGTVTPTSYLFKKKGRVAFEADERKLSVDDVLDEAIEAGAEDVETTDDGGIVVWTEPSQTIAAAEALQKTLDLKVESSDIIWDANKDTMVEMEDHHVGVKLKDFVEALQDNSEVGGVFVNARQGSLEDDVWEEIQERLDA